MENAAAHPKFVRWAVVLGIVVVLNAFLFVAANVAFEAPKYGEFCPAGKQPAVTTQTECEATTDGMWQPYYGPVAAGTPNGYCDFEAKCREPWEAAQSAHSLKVFAFMVVAGIVAIAAGVLLTGSAIVSSGLSYGGVVALVIGSLSYWGDADDLVRLAISGAALLALLYLGWKKFRD